MKALSFSLFGYGNVDTSQWFAFPTYMRGLMYNVRISRVLYPNWDIAVHTDERTYNSEFKPVFDWLQNKGFIRIVICEPAPLCLAMLWRLKPVFEVYNGWKYTHVICRDIDSIGTYREAQAVQTWIDEDKTIHCITDSISHNIPMMGGMIGARPAHFTERMNSQTWDEFIKLSSIEFTRKGSDQDFLNRVVYPRCHDSATEHFILGMKQTIPAGGGRHYVIDDVQVRDVDEVHKVLNDCAGHIGASGCYEPPTLKWLNTLDPYQDEYSEIEKKFPQLFFWRV